MTEQEKTISKIEQSMRIWITRWLPDYENMEPSQLATTTQGDLIAKANPATQEIRAAFKDYCYIVKTQRELADGNVPVDKDEKTIEYFRSKLKVV